MVSQYLALLWCVDHSKEQTPQETLFCKFLPATYSCLSETILLRCTKYSLEIELQKLSSPVPHGQSEQYSLKSINSKSNCSTNQSYVPFNQS